MDAHTRGGRESACPPAGMSLNGGGNSIARQDWRTHSARGNGDADATVFSGHDTGKSERLARRARDAPTTARGR